MYHRKVPNNLLLVSLLSFFAVTAVQAEDKTTLSAVPSSFTESVAVSVPRIPLPPSQSELKVPPVTVELYQHDEEPIGNRKPLLLVHGLRGEFREGFRWDRVSAEFLKDPEFAKTFKIYYVRYNTYTLLPSVKPHFKRTVMDLYNSVGQKPITVVALSMGGNLIQESMEDTDVAGSIEKVMTLGTPFHGSPLFCYDWLRYSIIRAHSVPWVRFDLTLSYRLYFKRHPNLIEDLRWDNSDNGIPEVGKYSTWFPYHICGDVTRARWSNPRIKAINDHIKIDKDKFICYGGYLLTPFASPHPGSRVVKAIKWPICFAAYTVPYHMGFEHPVLRALNFEMARMPVAGKDDKGIVRGTSRYSLNDGITPLVSALFLPSEVLRTTPVNRESDIATIRRGVDVKKARVFRQIDHITFVDGYRPDRRLGPNMRDELEPELGEKTVFDWMLYDLLDRSSTVAGGAGANLTSAPSVMEEPKSDPELTQ